MELHAVTIKINGTILFSVIKKKTPKKHTNVEPQLKEKKHANSSLASTKFKEKSTRIQLGTWGLIDNAVETTHIRTDVSVSLSTVFSRLSKISPGNMSTWTLMLLTMEPRVIFPISTHALLKWAPEWVPPPVQHSVNKLLITFENKTVSSR